MRTLIARVQQFSKTTVAPYLSRHMVALQLGIRLDVVYGNANGTRLGFFTDQLLGNADPLALLVGSGNELIHRTIFVLPPIQPRDRKSTRLNSSHRCISYAV